MNQHPQVVAVDIHHPADLVLVAFFEEEPAEQLLVPRRQFGERFADLVAVLGRQQDVVHARPNLRRVVLVVQRGRSRPRAVLFEEDVVADAVDERAQAFGRVQAALLLEGLKHPRKGFLPDVLDGRGRSEPRAELQRQKLSEVLGEMAFGLRVGRDEALEVVPVELVASERPQSALIVGQFSISRVVLIHGDSLQIRAADVDPCRSGLVGQLCRFGLVRNDSPPADTNAMKRASTVITMHSTEFAWLSDEALIKWLTAYDRRPNLMIVAHGLPVEAVADQLDDAVRQAARAQPAAWTASLAGQPAAAPCSFRTSPR